MKVFARHQLKYLHALALAVVIGACGGTKVADVGTSGTGIVASGTISSFGSVFVNGVKFSTSASTVITDDGAAKTEGDLKVGQVVEIKGNPVDATNASANSIAVTKEIKGPVDVVFDAVARTLGVLGQKVLIDNNTIVDNNTGAAGLAGLALGTQVEVSGFREAAGIRATRIEAQNIAVKQFKLRGVIDEILSASSFRVGDTKVNYAGINVQNLPLGGLVRGLAVEVRAAAAPVDKTVIATSVEVKSGVDGKTGDKAEVEGIISAYDGNCKFNVGIQPVDACGIVLFENGTRADFADGKRIEAEGALNNNGVMVASKVQFKAGGGGGSETDQANVKFSALVQSTAGNSVSVLGKSISVNNNTQFEDEKDNQRPFNLSNFVAILKPGDHATITGYVDGSGNLVATRVQRDGRSEVSAQGRLESLIGGLLSVQGINVSIGTSTAFKRDDATITFSEFQSRVAIGRTIVKAKGSNSGIADNTINATAGEVEIED
ncbi:MAG: DUF5666 domain-containing protein [Burkholderiales bacterium]